MDSADTRKREEQVKTWVVGKTLRLRDPHSVLESDHAHVHDSQAGILRRDYERDDARTEPREQSTSRG